MMRDRLEVVCMAINGTGSIQVYRFSAKVKKQRLSENLTGKVIYIGYFKALYVISTI